ncbi:uncharacterized protein BKA55DRAFT_712671 [Fusarium redolens]|uniref:Uncharacterized protein n=1 Tax=Fusarium redolens TaxID=48865 RepID=A0A9P9KSV0_FUSRE|nr:uncharacterized protein BKA55DRAFT_712671 [Fusarium redolens]KAH7267886.1 hypothetical protein BKA55DRAFT_712671 [Fusarium redolens]
MMSTWRFQGHWRTQPQGGSSGYLPKQGVSRAIVPHRCGLPRNAAAQTEDGETSGHLQRLRRPLEPRMPLALRPQLPSIRLLFPDMFANQSHRRHIEACMAPAETILVLCNCESKKMAKSVQPTTSL